MRRREHFWVCEKSRMDRSRAPSRTRRGPRGSAQETEVTGPGDNSRAANKGPGQAAALGPSVLEHWEQGIILGVGNKECIVYRELKDSRKAKYNLSFFTIHSLENLCQPV